MLTLLRHRGTWDILKEVTCKPNLKDEEERGVFLAAWRSGEQEITALHWGKFTAWNIQDK